MSREFSNSKTARLPNRL